MNNFVLIRTGLSHIFFTIDYSHYALIFSQLCLTLSYISDNVTVVGNNKLELAKLNQAETVRLQKYSKLQFTLCVN